MSGTITTMPIARAGEAPDRRIYVGDGLLFVHARRAGGNWVYADGGKELIFAPNCFLVPGPPGTGASAIEARPIALDGSGWNADNHGLRAQLALLMIANGMAGRRQFRDLDAAAYEAGPTFCAAMIARLSEEKS